MKLKKTMVCLLSGAMCASALAGCTASKQTGLTEDGKILLQVTTTQKEVDESAFVKDTAKHREFEEFWMKEFPDSNGVHIEPHYYKYSSRDFAAVAAGGQLPTYYSVPMTEAKAIMDAGYAKDITKYMEEFGYTKGLDEKVAVNIMRDTDEDGEKEIYLMPSSLYTVGIAVNMDLLRQAGYVDEDGTPHQPATYDEFAQMAKKIKEVTGKAGIIMPTTNNVGGWRFTPIAWAYGVDFMEQDEDGNWQATFNTPECVEALQWVKDLKWKYDVIQENVLLDDAKSRNAFGAGEGAMTFAEGSSTTQFMVGGMEKDNLGFIQIPAGPKRHVTLMGGAYYVFNRDATDEQVEAAFRYLDWLGKGRVLDDDVKARVREDIQIKIDRGELIGVLNSSPYTNDDPKRAYEIQLNTVDMANVNMNQVKLYNDQSNIEWQSEEPIEAQALYNVLDSAMQAVLTDENADCAKLIEEACKNFQTTLDTVNNG